MIIRTQNKKSIVYLDRVHTICTRVDKRIGEIKKQYETEIIYFIGGYETIGVLGKYSSEEKAIKVLDMIQEEFRSQLSKNKVLEMPEDSEVQDERKIVRDLQ